MWRIFLVASLDTSNRTQFKRSMGKGGIYKLNVLGISFLVAFFNTSNVTHFTCRFPFRWLCFKYLADFIANSSACTTTELSILLTSCLTAIKNHVIKHCTTVYERNGKKLFWSIKNSGEILSKLKSRDFLASVLSTYDFSTLYTTLPHNLIKEKLTELIEQTFNREDSLYCMIKMPFLLLNNLNDINCGHVRKCVMRSIIFWTIYL